MKHKNELVITIIISILIIFLKLINVLQIENGLGQPIIIVLLICIFSFISIFIQKKIDKNYKLNLLNYDNLDVLKYISAFLIIILHLRPFQYYSSELDLAFNNIITRICVPIFFLITGYFVAKKEKNKDDYIKHYIKKTIPLYLIWSVIYIPIIITIIIQCLPTINGYVSQINLPLYYLIPLLIIAIPVTIIIALLYTGVYYHLWYFPAVILSLLVLSKWKKKFNIKSLLIISFVLLLFGATETYYGVLPLGFKQIITYYYNIFFTTRNFLFFGLFYIVLGHYMGTKEELYSKYCFEKLIICFFLLVFEAILLHDTNRLNSNILLSCVPLVYYLFIATIYITRKKQKVINFSFRNYSKYYYLIHPMIIFILYNIGILNADISPIISILYVLLGTHIASFMIIKAKQLRN